MRTSLFLFYTNLNKIRKGYWLLESTIIILDGKFHRQLRLKHSVVLSSKYRKTLAFIIVDGKIINSFLLLLTDGKLKIL